jgi:hypothetical protein
MSPDLVSVSDGNEVYRWKNGQLEAHLARA